MTNRIYINRDTRANFDITDDGGVKVYFVETQGERRDFWERTEWYKKYATKDEARAEIAKKLGIKHHF